MKEAKSDVALKGQLWIDYIDKLKGVIFDTQWQLFALCISIGIMYDKQVDFSALEGQNTSIPRSMLNRLENRSLLEYMFQTAILTTRTVDFNEKTRLFLAFGEDKDKDNDNEIEIDPNFNEYTFLAKFANYGLTVLDEQLKNCTNDIETMQVMMSFLNNKYENGIQPELDIDSIDFSELVE